MNLFPRTSYTRMPSMPKTAMPKAPRLSLGMGKLSLPKVSGVKMTQPKSPSSPSFKSFDSSKFMGPTSGQKSSASMLKSVQPKKMAIVKGVVGKLKLK